MITDVSHLKMAQHPINISISIPKNISIEHFPTIQSRFLLEDAPRKDPYLEIP